MYKSWKQGIPCFQFRNERLDDINKMVEIDEAINIKVQRKSSVDRAIRELR